MIDRIGTCERCGRLAKLLTYAKNQPPLPSSWLMRPPRELVIPPLVTRNNLCALCGIWWRGVTDEMEALIDKRLGYRA